jgi:hypothetical protein
MAPLWFFLVLGLGAHNGHSFVNRVVVDRIVEPTLAACEAARRGFEEYNAAEGNPLYEAGPCQQLPPDASREPTKGRK